MCLAQSESYWEADGDGQGVYSRPSIRICALHTVLRLMMYLGLGVKIFSIYSRKIVS